MKRLLLLVFLTLFLTSCGSSRRIPNSTVNKPEKILISNKTVEKVVDHAKRFEGTRYKFGGTTNKGMDCSGLVYTAFKEEDIIMPRISRDMAKRGVRISLRDVEEGDLVFFQTNKNRRVINHVGLVVENKRGEIFFIHSTTSRGVITSSLEEGYWKNSFIEARRVI